MSRSTILNNNTHHLRFFAVVICSKRLSRIRSLSVSIPSFRSSELISDPIRRVPDCCLPENPRHLGPRIPSPERSERSLETERSSQGLNILGHALPAPMIGGKQDRYFSEQNDTPSKNQDRSGPILITLIDNGHNLDRGWRTKAVYG